MSIDSKYINEMEDFTIKFTEFDSVHEKILNNLKSRAEEDLNDKVIGFWNWLVTAASDLGIDK